MSNKISAIIPTLNEEVNIENAIKTLGFADEILIIDSFSTDKTLEIANKYPVKVIQRKFDNFSSQKNFALEHTKNNWTYVLDADERVTPKLKEEILRTVKSPNGKAGFYVYRTFYFIGKKIKYSGWKNDKAVRLFKKDECRYNGDLVHEVIKTDGELGFLKNRLDHFSYRSFDQYITKLNKYSWLQAKELKEKDLKVNAYHIVIKPPVRFFIHYVIKLGFLDGFPGFIISVLLSYGVLARYIKLWLLKRNLR